jgi:hypothetical protein
MSRRSHFLLSRRAPLTLAAALILFGCGDSSGPPDGPQPPGQLVIKQQPSGAKVGVALSQQPVVELQDCWDRLVDTSGVVVTASVVSGTATIKSGGEAVSVHGVATFDKLVLVGRTNAPVVVRFSIPHRSGVAGKTTVRSSASLTLEVGVPVAVQPRDPTTYAGSVGTVVNPAPSVTVVDAGQNPLSGVPVTFSVLQGAGRLQDSVVTSDANGIARLGAWTLGLPGVNRVTARINDTTGALFTASATGAIGMLRVRVTGRPDAEAAPVRIVRTSIGSPAFDSVARVLDTLTLTGIPFGQYAVVGDSINRGDRIWLPRTSYVDLTVSTTSGPEVKLDYVEHGRVAVTVRGLPSPTISVPIVVIPQDTTLPRGTINARNDAVTRAVLPIGSYELVAPAIIFGGERFAPLIEQQTVNFRGGGEVTTLNVQYVQTSGDLTVGVTGLPTGATAQVDITGPNGFRETVFMNGSRSYSGLAPGTYTVKASNTTVGTQTFTTNPAIKTVEVTAAANTVVSFSYTAVAP